MCHIYLKDVFKIPGDLKSSETGEEFLSDLFKRFDKFEQEQRKLLGDIDKRLQVVEGNNLVKEESSNAKAHETGAGEGDRGAGDPVILFNHKRGTKRSHPNPPPEEESAGLAAVSSDELRLEFESIRDSLS